jgi:hypothetical protein
MVECSAMSDGQNFDSEEFRGISREQEFQEQQDQKRLAFELNQERKRQEFEARLEKQKAKRDWVLVSVTFLAAAIAIATTIVTHQDARDSLNAQINSVEQQISVQQSAVTPYVLVQPVLNKKGFAAFETRQWQGEQSPRIFIPFILTARGQTPAIAITVNITCTAEWDAKNVIKKQFAHTQSPSDNIPIAILADKDEHKLDCLLLGQHTYIGVHISYSDVFSNQHTITYIFHATQNNNDINIYLDEPPNIEVKYAPRR